MPQEDIYLVRLACARGTTAVATRLDGGETIFKPLEPNVRWRKAWHLQGGTNEMDGEQRQSAHAQKNTQRETRAGQQAKNN